MIINIPNNIAAATKLSFLVTARQWSYTVWTESPVYNTRHSWPRHNYRCYLIDPLGQQDLEVTWVKWSVIVVYLSRMLHFSTLPCPATWYLYIFVSCTFLDSGWRIKISTLIIIIWASLASGTYWYPWRHWV